MTISGKRCAMKMGKKYVKLYKHKSAQDDNDSVIKMMMLNRMKYAHIVDM